MHGLKFISYAYRLFPTSDETNLMKSFLLCLIFVLVNPWSSEAQYRRNDKLHAGHQAYDSPERVSPSRSATLAFGTGEIVVEWSAPSVRHRQLLGRLIPSERIWRTGANEATVIHFDDDVIIGRDSLAAGSYALFTIGGEEEWTFIFNSESQQWGAFSHDPEHDALRIQVIPTSGDHQEELAFALSSTTKETARVVLSWGTIRVGFDARFAH